MIQVPAYMPINTTFAQPQLQQSQNQQLSSIHTTYYPDLTKEEFCASEPVRNEMLYKQGKLEQLAKYGTYTNCGLTYNKLKDNNDFKELINSKYLNNTKGFVCLINNLNSLEIQRHEKLSHSFYPNYSLFYNNSIQKNIISYEKYNLNDYVRILNNFIKNDKLSDDLKQYFLYFKSDKLDLYYTKLDNLENKSNPLDTLTQKIFYIKE